MDVAKLDQLVALRPLLPNPNGETHDEEADNCYALVDGYKLRRFQFCIQYNDTGG